jgi:hypothetical protein
MRLALLCGCIILAVQRTSCFSLRGVVKAHPVTSNLTVVRSVVDVPSSSAQSPVVAVPGGGIFFWWQIGAVAALHEVSNHMCLYTVLPHQASLLSSLLGMLQQLHESLIVTEPLVVYNKSCPKWRFCTEVAVPRLRCSSLLERYGRVCVVVYLSRSRERRVITYSRMCKRCPPAQAEVVLRDLVSLTCMLPLHACANSTTT